MKTENIMSKVFGILSMVMLTNCVFLDAFSGAPPGNLSDHEVRSAFQKAVQQGWLQGCNMLNMGQLQGGVKCDKFSNLELYVLTAGAAGVSFLELPDPYYTEGSVTDCKTEASFRAMFFTLTHLKEKIVRFESNGQQVEGIFVDEVLRSAVLAGKLAADACMSKLKPGGRIIQAYGVGF